MSTEIPWDESRKEWKPVDMTVTYNGDGKFTGLTSSGIAFPLEAPVGMGGQVKYCDQEKGSEVSPDSRMPPPAGTRLAGGRS
jgi:hypothetical protein